MALSLIGITVVAILGKCSKWYSIKKGITPPKRFSTNSKVHLDRNAIRYVVNHIHENKSFPQMKITSETDVEAQHFHSPQPSMVQSNYDGLLENRTDFEVTMARDGVGAGSIEGSILDSSYVFGNPRQSELLRGSLAVSQPSTCYLRPCSKDADDKSSIFSTERLEVSSPLPEVSSNLGEVRLNQSVAPINFQIINPGSRTSHFSWTGSIEPSFAKEVRSSLTAKNLKESFSRRIDSWVSRNPGVDELKRTTKSHYPTIV